MKIKIRSFAMIREIIGKKKISLEVKENQTIELIVRDLVKIYPELKKFLLRDEKLNPNYVFAINGERSDYNTISDLIIKEGDELAILPPAGGG